VTELNSIHDIDSLIYRQKELTSVVSRNLIIAPKPNQLIQKH